MRISLVVDDKLHRLLTTRAKNNRRSLVAEINLLIEAALAIEQQKNVDLLGIIWRMENSSGVEDEGLH